MNKPKFQMYNLISPKENDILEIANYIMDNKILSLPYRLRNSLSLAVYLMEHNYNYLLDLKFSDKIYNDIKIDDFVKYIINRSNSTSYYKLPIVYRNDPNFYNLLLKRDPPSIYFIRDNISSDVYNKLDKNILADTINTIYYFSDSKMMGNDLELFKIMMSKKYGSINFNLFSDKVLSAYGYDKITDFILNSKDFRQYNSIPKVILNNRDLITKICNYSDQYDIMAIIADERLSLENKYYLIANYECYGMGDKYTEGFIQYVIDNKIKNIVNTKMKNDLFHKLLEKDYQYFFNIYAMHNINNDIDDKTKEKIIDLYYQSDYTDVLSYDLKEIVFNSPKSLKNIAKIGDFIINTNVIFGASWPCRDSLELFNYLYDKGYDKLLSLNFNMSVFESVPVEKLKTFYKEHPSLPLQNINLKLRMEIQDINMDNIDYRKGKFIILYEERNNAQLVMEQYNNLSQNICSLLNIYPVNEVYNRFSKQLNDVQKVMNLSEHDIIDLFANYVLDPANNEEKILNLFRDFCSRQKELIAQRRLESRFNDIRAKNTKIDNTDISKKIKIKKRKALYLQFIVDAFLNNNVEYDKDRLKLSEYILSLGLDKLDIPEFLLITKIINGGEIIQKPSIYDKLEKHRITLRLKNNYEKMLMDIINTNSKYRKQIIDYIKGDIPYEEMRKNIDSNLLKSLYEMRNLYIESESKLIDLNGVVSFNASYDLSTEDINISREYESYLQAINRLRKYLNKDMNERISLDSIKINAADYDEYKSEDNDQKVFLDPFKIYDIDRVLELFNIKDNYSNQKCKRVFDKLFIDSGIIYGLPFVSTNLYLKMYEIAENMDSVLKRYDENFIDLNNLTTIIKSADTLKYLTPYNEAILGEKIISEIVNGDTFIIDKSVMGKRQRVEDGTKYISLAGRNIMSTLPYTRVETDEYVAERYRSDDPEILTTGIKTDACFRLYGNDNDFLLYTMFNKNGIVVRLSDKDGNFVGRISGFRNGNTVYFNQLRTIYDKHGNPSKNIIENVQKIRDCAEKYAQDLIESTKESDSPIENVLIIKAYGYANCEYLPVVDNFTPYPMSVVTDDFKDFRRDSELKFLEYGNGFTTDYQSSLPVLLLANDDSKKFNIENDSQSHDTKAIYERPRKKPVFYKNNEINTSLLSKINIINAKNIYWGSKEKRENAKKIFSLLKSYDDIYCAVVGDDFYIFIDNYGNIHELCLPYDSRAYAEFEKYREIILDTYESNKNKSK